MRRVTELLRNLLGLDDGATTSLAQLENSAQRVRWRIAVGASLVLGAVAIVITIVVSSIATLGAESVGPGDLLMSASTPMPGAPGTTGATGSSGESGTSGGEIFVHVVGAVQVPGLYAVRVDARVVDAVMAAGGLAATADPCAINLAHSIEDGQQIVVPATADGAAGNEALCSTAGGGRADSTNLNSASNTQAGASGAGGAQVSLGTAGVAELDTLPGIGPALAQRIIDWRDATGGFTSIEQLSEVSGIGDKVMANIRDLVTL
ncbi:MAG: ComEA family DNA-binding protein [Actinomycetales bacterium]|nr:ComEA family DNA-binding protein [Actinomycetales bacterium]